MDHYSQRDIFMFKGLFKSLWPSALRYQNNNSNPRLIYHQCRESRARTHSFTRHNPQNTKYTPFYTNCLRAHSISREAQLVYRERDVHSKASLLLKFVQNKEWRVNMDLRYFYKRYSGGGCGSETHSAVWHCTTKICIFGADKLSLPNSDAFFWFVLCVK